MGPGSDWIKKLGLHPHPEGGYFAETYRSEDLHQLPGFDGPRNIYTSIYFLLQGNDFSAFHRLKADEIWHFYDGCPVLLHIIDKKGSLEKAELGGKNGFQYLVKKGCWFSAEPMDKSSYSLVGCSMSPGFDMKDFELGQAVTLAGMYPDHADIIYKRCIR